MGLVITTPGAVDMNKPSQIGMLFTKAELGRISAMERMQKNAP